MVSSDVLQITGNNMTHIELKERLLSLDVIELVELLQIESEHIVTMFSDIIEERHPALEEYLDPTDEVEIGTFNNDEYAEGD